MYCSDDRDLQTLEKAYKFARYYLEHLPVTIGDWQVLRDRISELAGTDEFALSIFCDVADMIDRRSKFLKDD